MRHRRRFHAMLLCSLLGSFLLARQQAVARQAPQPAAAPAPQQVAAPDQEREPGRLQEVSAVAQAPQSGSITLRGVVTDSQTGWPLYARVDATGGDKVLRRAYTSILSGEYSLSLPASGTYTLKVQALSPGYPTRSQSIALAAEHETLDVALAIDQRDCSALGYRRSVVGTWLPFDAKTVPADWSVVDSYGYGGIWRFDNPGARSNQTGGSGNFAIADTLAYGSMAALDTSLVSPAFDFTALTTVQLSFNTDVMWTWTPYPSGRRAEVDVSNDNGATWTTVWQRVGSSYRGPQHELIDVSALAAGHSQVRLRLHYVSPTGSHWWQVDNVQFGRMTCDPSAGQRVFGHVYDANTSLPVNNAAVVVSPTYQVASSPTLDPALDDGLYMLFLEQPGQPITATRTGGYGYDVRVPPTDGPLVRQDFFLPAGRLAVAPATLATTLTLGLSVTLEAQLANQGERPVIAQLDLSTAEPWVSGQPFTTTLAAQQTRPFTLTVHADEALIQQPGEYLSAVTLDGDHPYGPIELPIHMTVTPPPTWGKLQGSVTGLKPCDQPGTPIANAKIQIAGRTGETWTTSTTGNGGYAWWLDEASGPYTVTISAPSYTPQVHNQLVVTAATTTNLAVDLRRALPCLQLRTPNVATTVTLGTTSTLLLGLANSGAQTATTTLRHATGPATRPWLLNVPADLSLAPDSEPQHPLVVDARDPAIRQPGVYTTTLKVDASNDTAPGLTVPVSVTVTPPDGWSLLSGRVVGLGACDTPGTTLAGATLTAAASQGASIGVTTDAAGRYTLWYDPATGPLTTTIAATGYVSQTIGGISGAPNGQETRDVELRLQAPCVQLAPASISVSQLAETQQVLPITVTNTGAGTLDLSLLEVGARGGPAATDVLVYVTNSTQGHMVKNFLREHPDIGRVTVVPADGSWVPAPTLAELQAYDLVISFRNLHYYYLDEAQLGNVLADYVDGGGKLLLLALNWDRGPGGRFASGGYSPFAYIWKGHYSSHQLGTYQAGHPLMRGVRTASTQYYDKVVVAPGAELVASWNTGYDFVATTPGVVAINAAPSDYMPWGGDLPRVLHNSVSYLLDAPWLKGTAAYQMVGPGASASISLTLDTTIMPVAQPGVYTTTLMAVSSYRPGPHPTLPLTLTVRAPQHWGALQGRVEGAPHCNQAPAPLANVEVVLTSGAGRRWTTRTTADGGYVVWLDADTTPLTLTASYGGYSPQTVRDIQLAPQATMTQNVTLRRLVACLEVSPPTPSFTATMDISHTATLRIANRGAAAADVTIQDDWAWLTLGPASFRLAADSTQVVTLTFDTGSAEVSHAGLYSTTLVVRDGAAPGANLLVPLRLQVEEPQGAGTLRGVVSGLDYCDAPLGPLRQASVVIQSHAGITWTLHADASGAYGRELSSQAGPYAITVSHQGYQPVTLGGLSVSPRQVTQQDVTLRRNMPCIALAPSQPRYVVAAGTSATETITLTNTGAGSSAYDLQAIQELDVLIVHAQSPSPNTVATPLSAYKTVRTIDQWDAYSNQRGIPTLEDLKPYDVVIVLGTQLYNGVTMGNVLADYLDAGGRLILTAYEWSTNFGGRMGSGYLPFKDIGPLRYGDAALGSYDALHPLMRQLTAMSAYYRDTVELAPGGQLVARWSDQEEFIAVKGRVVAINGFTNQSGTHSNVGLLFYNALNYLQPVPWLTLEPQRGSLAGDQGQPIEVRLQATTPPIAEPGWYTASLSLVDEDARNSVLAGRIELFVPPAPELGLLEGQVRGWSYCNAGNKGLKFARVTLRGSDGSTRVLISDPTGRYSVYLPGQRQYTVSSAYAGYVASEPLPVSMAPGARHVQDIDLRVPESCAKSSTQELEIFVRTGTSATYQLMVQNTGGITGSVLVAETPPGGWRLTPASYPLAWDELAPYPSAVENAGAAELDGKIYVVGGSTDAGGPNPTRSGHVYTPETNSWAPIASMAQQHDILRLVAAQGQLYAFGSVADPRPTSEIYDPAKNQWSPGPAHPSTRPLAAVVAMDGAIYTVSYCGNPCAQPELYRYDLATKAWQKQAGYPAAANVGGCVVLHSSLYCLHGNNGYRYTPGTNSWSAIAYVPGAGGTLTVSNNQLLVLGVPNVAAPSFLMTYDPLRNAWETRGEWGNRREGAATACGFYWIGGRINFDYTASNKVSRLRGLYPCGPLDHVPWLDYPTQPTLIGRDVTQGVPLTVDATLPSWSAPGVYTTSISLVTSDPVGTPVATLPLIMHVLPAETPLLQGQIRAWDACGAATTALAGAQVTVTGADGQEHRVVADSHGRYQLLLQEWSLPLSIDISHPGYHAGQVSYAGPVKPDMVASASLRPNSICVSSTSVVEGDATSFTASLAWTTADSYEWDFGDGTTSTGSSVEHHYASAGTYAVRVTAFVGNEVLRHTFAVQVLPASQRHKHYLPLTLS